LGVLVSVLVQVAVALARLFTVLNHRSIQYGALLGAVSHFTVRWAVFGGRLGWAPATASRVAVPCRRRHA
jgi:hypothetical protein